MATRGADVDFALFPNPPLSRGASALVLGGVGVVCAGGGAAFAAAGAWPVTGFFGLDLLLLFLAFRASRGAQKRFETVRVEGRALVVARHGPRGAVVRARFDAHWVAVALERGAAGGSRLLLRSHGAEIVIGSFLTDDERGELAVALRGALADWRVAQSVDCRLS